MLTLHLSDGHAVVGVPGTYPLLLRACVIDIALPGCDRLLGFPVADGDPYPIVAADALHGDKAGLSMR